MYTLATVRARELGLLQPTFSAPRDSLYDPHSATTSLQHSYEAVCASCLGRSARPNIGIAATITYNVPRCSALAYHEEDDEVLGVPCWLHLW